MVKFNNAVFELVVLYKNLENFDQYIDFWMWHPATHHCTFVKSLQEAYVMVTFHIAVLTWWNSDVITTKEAFYTKICKFSINTSFFWTLDFADAALHNTVPAAISYGLI